MKSRVLFAVLLLVAGCMATLVGHKPPSSYVAVAQAAPTPAILKFQISSVGTSQVLPLGGQSYCGIIFTSVGTGVTADIEGTVDGNSFATLTQAPNSGSFAPPTANTQTNFSPLASGASALTGIRLNVTAISTGPVVGTLVCSNSSPGVSGTITAVISGTVNTNIVGPTCANTLPCVQISSLPGPAQTDGTGRIVVTTPAPAPTCNTGTAVCVQGNQGTNNNVLQTLITGPLGSTSVDVHAAGTAATNPLGVQNQKYGTSTTYIDPIGDTFAQSGAISTAVTTLLVSGVAGQNIYVYMMAFQLSGTNAGNTVNWEWGTGATCGTSTKTLYPQAQSPGTAAGNWIYGWSGAVIALTVVQFPAPAAVPLVIPAGNNLCGVTAGTTTAGVFVTYSANH